MVMEKEAVWEVRGRESGHTPRAAPDEMSSTLGVEDEAWWWPWPDGEARKQVAEGSGLQAWLGLKREQLGACLVLT